MKELGRILRDKREQLGLSLDEVQTLTKIRKRYLMAVEEGNWAILPGDVYARGFVRSYAECLGLDGRALLEQYAESKPSSAPVTPTLQGEQPAKEQKSVADKPQSAPATKREARIITRPMPSTTGKRSLRRGSGMVGQTIAVVAALAVLGGVWWAVGNHTDKPSTPSADNTAAVGGNQVAAGNVAAANNAAAGSNATNGTPDNTANGTTGTAPGQAQTQVVSEPFQNNLQTYRVSASQPMSIVLTAATNSCWVKVTSDGNVVDGSDTILRGQSKTWQANQSLVIRVGNVPAVTLTVNGQAVTLPSTTNAIDVQFVKSQA